MKKQLFAVVVAAGMLFAGATPAKAEIYGLSVPQGAVAMKEKEMDALRKWEGKACDPFTTNKKHSCPAVVTIHANNNVLLSQSEGGALYRLNAVQVNRKWASDSGYVWKLHLQHFLPDGFYHVGKKYYWVADGKQMNLGKKKEFKYKQFKKYLTADSSLYINVDGKTYTQMHEETALYESGCVMCMHELSRDELRELMRLYEGAIVHESQDNFFSMVSPGGLNYAIGGLDTKKQFKETVLQMAIPNVDGELVRSIPQMTK